MANEIVSGFSMDDISSDHGVYLTHMRKYIEELSGQNKLLVELFLSWKKSFLKISFT